ncbi:MAG: TRAP transporter small permease [Gammaproteobacteria bacterium]|nr:TRAP transporter small permease [Gammaproteobacteria bacterium]
MSDILKTLERIGRLFEDASLVIMLCVLVGLAATQIFLRNIMDTGFVWADELLRLLVLWLVMLGAVAASRDDRHIRIDILSRFLSDKWKLVTTSVLDLFTAVVCGIVAWYAASFVIESREYEDTLLGGLPAWPFQLILPVAFACIAYRYLIFFMQRVYHACTQDEQ